MAEKTVCVQHPMTSKYFWTKVEDNVVQEEKPVAKDVKQVEKSNESEMDGCMKNEECRAMFLRLQALTAAKTGFPGL